MHYGLLRSHGSTNLGVKDGQEIHFSCAVPWFKSGKIASPSEIEFSESNNKKTRSHVMKKDRSGFISENLLRRAKLDKQLSFYQELEGSGVKGVNAVKAGSLVINRKPASIQVVEGPELDAKFS